MIKKLIFKGLMLVFAVGAGTALILFMLVYNGFFGPVPDVEDIRNIHNIEATIIYDIKGERIGKFYQQDRTPVAFDEISPTLIKALVATEDKRFYEHHGIDFRSLLRVAVKTVLLQKSSSGGGSTITLQLAKNLYPRQSYAFLYYPINKIKEGIIAYRIENQYSKDEIITLYLNTVSFGGNVYGVQSAAHRYFSADAASLNPQQAATLVGMLKATTSYNPVLHPEASLKRRNTVLTRLLQAGELDEVARDSIAALPLDLAFQPKSQQLAAYYLAQIKKKVRLFLEEYNAGHETELNLLTDGLRIYTSLDKGMQQKAEEAMATHMEKLQKIFDKHWYDNDLWAKHKTLLDREIKRSAHGRSPKAMQEKREMFVYQPGEPDYREMSPIDSIKYYLQQLQAGFVALQPQSGAIKAWVGGIDYQFFPYDHVNYQARRQVGSTFKPIVYAAAIENGVSPCRYYKAEQEVYEVKEGEWKPANDDADYEGKYSMEGALENSVNTVSVKILEEVGIDKTIALARAMGIRAPIPEVPSIALGTASISLLEMVTAYSTFVNGGKTVSPYMIERIEDRDGNVLYERQPKAGERVLSEKTSSMMTHLLQGVVNNGTGRSLRTVYKLSNAIGGKTGTTQNNADGWFMAITPRLVAGAWVGGIYPEISFTSTRLGQGATMALPIFAGFYGKLDADSNYRNYTAVRFKPLPGQWQSELDCDPFKEEFNLFERLFGKKDDKSSDQPAKPEKEAKQGVFKKLKKLFKKN